MPGTSWIPGVAKHWKFSGALGRVALTVAAPSTAAAVALIWVGGTIPGAIAAVGIAAIATAMGFRMLTFAENRPESVLEGAELIKYYGMIQAKGSLPALPGKPESDPLVVTVEEPAALPAPPEEPADE